MDGAIATVTDDTPEQNTYTAELINMPADKTYDGKTVDLTTVTVQKSVGFPDSVSVGTVSLKDKSNNTVTTAKNVGTYTAYATVGDQTISKVFTIHARDPILYVKSTTVDGDAIVITIDVTDQYLLLESNPYGITLLMDGEIYVASGNIEIGALIFVGDAKLILRKNTKATTYAGIYHIGSTLDIYIEEGADDSAIIVKGNKNLADLNNYSDFQGQTISDENAAISGDIRVHGGKLIVEQGNSNLVSDDISLTLGAGLSTTGTTNSSEFVYLTGGTENSDGSVTYDKEDFVRIASLVVKPVAVVESKPAAKTLTYDGSAQELVSAGEAAGGTMYYALGTDATTAPEDDFYMTAVPTATGVGTYHVWYKGTGDEDHNDSKPACVSTKIGRGNLSKAKVTLVKSSYAYDGKAKEPKAKVAGRTSATLKGLKPGKAYYVKVRPLREASDTTYVGVVRYCKATVKAK